MKLFSSASVVVWVVFEIAMRPEYLKALREEVLHNVDSVTDDLDPSNIGEAIQKAPWLDSFIREVMRTKGDTLATCRMTAADIELGGYTIPKGRVKLSASSCDYSNRSLQPFGVPARDTRTFKSYTSSRPYCLPA